MFAGGGSVDSVQSVDYEESFVAPTMLDANGDGLTGGVGLGARIATSSGFFFGVEAQHSVSNIEANQTVPTLDNAGVQVSSDTTRISQTIHSFTGASAVVGYSMGDFDIAVKAGPSWASVTDQTWAFEPNNGMGVSTKDDSVVSGYTLGGEVGYKIPGTDATLFTEVTYHNYGEPDPQMGMQNGAYVFASSSDERELVVAVGGMRMALGEIFGSE